MKKFKHLSLLLVIAFFAFSAEAKVQTAKVSVDVDPGVWKSVRLKNLPQNASLKVEVKCDSPITFVLVNEGEYGSYPDISRSLFQSTVRDSLSFAVKIPATGNYYLVFDNSEGKSTVKVDTVVQGASGADALFQQSSRSVPQDNAFEKDLGALATDLNRLFIFDPFPISAKRCGKEGAFSGPEGVIVCLEFVKKVSTTMGDREKARNVLLFTIFHEVGHQLLYQWGYPFYDNEEVADEFATVMIVLLGQKERLTAMTEFFLSNPSSNELIAKAFKGDRHPLSIERARNIVRWMKDGNRIKRWQVLFVPNMQTAALERLQSRKETWIDAGRIEAELAARRRSDIPAGR